MTHAWHDQSLFANTHRLAVTSPTHPRSGSFARADVSSLTRAIARGDADALGALYESWFDRLFDAASAITGRDESFCLDVVQDTMLTVARSLPVLASHAELGAWLRTCLVSRAIDRIRSERRRRTREHAVAREETRLPPIAEQNEWLQSVLAELKPEDRELLFLRFARDSTLGAIAANSHAPTSADATHGRIRRILTRLQEKARELFP